MHLVTDFRIGCRLYDYNAAVSTGWRTDGVLNNQYYKVQVLVIIGIFAFLGCTITISSGWRTDGDLNKQYYKMHLQYLWLIVSLKYVRCMITQMLIRINNNIRCKYWWLLVSSIYLGCWITICLILYPVFFRVWPQNQSNQTRSYKAFIDLCEKPNLVPTLV